MPNSLTVKLNGDSSNLEKALNSAKESIEKTVQSSDRLENIQEKFDNIVHSTASLKRRLRDLQTLMSKMNLDGLTDTDLFARMAEQAGTYADAIGDARTAINAFANDNMKLEALAQGFQLITGSASMLTGALSMCGVENDKLENAMLKVQSAIALVNGVTAIANVLNKDSALMLRLKAIRLAANTAAQQENTVATVTNSAATTVNTTSTVANSVATTANNTARKIWNVTVAISKALMGDFTGLVMLGAAALTTYALCTDNSTDSVKKNNNAVQFSKKVTKEYSDELSSSMRKNVARVKELGNQFNSLQTEGAKNEWIKQNTTELNRLGVSVRDLITLDKQFQDGNSDVITSMERRAETINNLNKVHNRYLEETASKSGDLVGRFMELKREWDSLKTVAEKKEWLNENQTAFSNLGISVGDLTTAERIFVNDTSKVVKALEARAQAMAAQTAMTKAYSDYYDKKLQNANTVKGGGFYQTVKEGDKVSHDEVIELLKYVGSVNKQGQAVNNGSFRTQNGNLLLTEKGAEQMNEKRQKEARARRLSNDAQAEEQLSKTLTFYSQETVKATENIKALGLNDIVSSTDKGTTTNNKNKGGSHSSKNEKIDYLVSVDDGSLDVAEKKLSAWQSKLKVTPTTDEEGIKHCQDEITKWEKEVEKRKILIETQVEEGSKTYIENHIKKLEEKKKVMFQTVADTLEIKKVNDEIERYKKKLEQEEIRLGIKPKIESNSLNDIKNQIKEKEDEIQLLLNTNISPDSIKKLVSELDRLRKKEESKEIELGVKINNPTIHKEEKKFERGSVEDKKESLSNAKSMIDDLKYEYKLKLIGKNEVESQLKQINSLLEELGLKPIELHFNSDGSLTDSFEDLERFNNQMAATSNIASSLGSVFTSIGGAINESTGEWLSFAGQSLNAISQILPQILTLITAKQAEAMASGTASAASLPFPANLAAMASVIATIASLFASIPKFESGGIVGGSSYSGDKLFARVNSGEMILNQRQQRNLYDSMNNAEIVRPQGANTLRGEVDFRISGSSLKGCLKNYEQKTSRIR